MSDNEYRLLLWKFIEHVGQCEGVDFTDDRYRGWSCLEDIDGQKTPLFTDSEWSLLQSIATHPQPIRKNI